MKRALATAGLLASLFAIDALEACADQRPAQQPAQGQPEGFHSVENPALNTGRRVLRHMLDQRIDAESRGQTAEVEKIDAELRAKFEKKLAVMVTDMSGFTARTKKIGIIGFLSEVRRLFHLAEPIVFKHQGSWVKVDADDLFVTTESAKEMFLLAQDLREAIAAHNQEDKEHPIGLSIGLGFGPTLVVEHDIWGDSVNTASKLGEDVGEAGEILVSPDFFAQLDKDQAARCSPVDDFKSRGSKYLFYTCR